MEILKTPFELYEFYHKQNMALTENSKEIERIILLDLPRTDIGNAVFMDTRKIII